MATPEKAGRERTAVPVLPKPEVRPVPPVSPKQEKGPSPTKKTLIQRLAENLAVRLALVGTALGGAGYAAYENVPAIHSAVDSAFLDHLKGKSVTEASINTEVFDNNALRGTISNENTLVLSPEEIKRTFPPIIIDSVNNSSTILFPFQLPEGTKSQFTKTTVVPKDNPSGFSNQAEKVDILTILLPIGTKIINPIEGAHVTLWTGNAKLGEDPNLVRVAYLYWYDKVNDRLYVFSITPTILPGPMFKPVIQGDEYYNKAGYQWETLPIADRGLGLMETTQDLQPIVVDVEIYSGKDMSPDTMMKRLGNKELRRGEVDFFTTQANNDGKTKLVVLGN